MFKFNFGNANEDTDEKDNEKSNIVWYECKKIEVGDASKEIPNYNEEKDIVKYSYNGDITLSCISPTRVIGGLKKETNNALSDVLEAENNHSDLLPGKYEGGLKIWECTRDLVNFLVQNGIDILRDKTVLDLGCGAGNLGIVALMNGGYVTFQDYNSEVLDLVTIPNVIMNVNNCDKAAFYSGDWDSFLDVMLGNNREEPSPKRVKSFHEKFDFILSSETIYNPDNYGKIYRVIKGLLKKDGVCYIAAKKCYFGVGGNTLEFVEYLRKENVLCAHSVWSSNEGVAREILKITFLE